MTKILILMIMIMATLAVAQTFNVSTTPELRTALETAATNGEDDTVVLADGTYKTTDDGVGTFIYLSNEANILTLIGSSSNNVILSGDNQHQIFNHTSAVSTNLKLNSLTFIDGYASTAGGGVYTKNDIIVEDCNFTNNIARSGIGGGGFTSAGAIVKNSYFINNVAESGGGGGFYAANYKYAYISNSTFINNTAYISGGGFTSNGTKNEVINSTFDNNKATIGSAGAISLSSTSWNVISTISNSIFTNNSSKYKGAVSAGYLRATNLLFKNNNGGLNLPYGNNNIVINSIFIDNNESDISSHNDVLPIIENNYIDENNILITSFNKNNIFDGVILDFINDTNIDYNLKSSSDLIDAGSTYLFDEGMYISAGIVNGILYYEESFLMPTNDINNNSRLAGGNIDIGPYEFSTTRPTINSLTYTGTATEQSELTFDTSYTLADSRTISSITYDFLNDGSYSSLNTHTFNIAGTYTVNTKITDDTGEFSIRSLSVTITPLAFSDMTDEQKLVKAIDPQYYNDIVAIITTKENTANASGVTVGENNVMLSPTSYNLVTMSDYNTALTDMNTTATASGIVSGREMVIASPSAYGLVLQSDLNSSVSEALTIGTESGKQYVQDNLTEFGLVNKVDIELTATTALDTGWTLTSTPFEITDLSIFDSATIVWVYNNNTSAWMAYSSDATMRQNIIDNTDISLLTTIPAGSGIWIQK